MWMSAGSGNKVIAKMGWQVLIFGQDFCLDQPEDTQ
jgi:hypothetical protein